MKKLGLLCLALVLALGALGVGYAAWTDTIFISGTVNTGNLSAIFRDVVSNDDGAVDAYFCVDGYHMANVDIGDNGGDPTAEQTMGASVPRIDNVANTTVAGAWLISGAYDNAMPPQPPTNQYQTITISMANAYPSYHPTVFFSVINAGTIPAKVKAVTLVGVSKGGSPTGSPNLTMVVCTTYYVDADTGAIATGSATADSDFSIHLSNDEGHLYDSYLQVYPGWPGTASGNLDIHVLDGAQQLTAYGFTIEIVVTQFNEP